MRRAKFQRLPNEIQNMIDYSVNDSNNPHSQKLYPFYERNISENSYDWDDQNDATYDPSIYCATNNFFMNGIIINSLEAVRNIISPHALIYKEDVKVDDKNEDKFQIHKLLSSDTTSSRHKGKCSKVKTKKQKRSRKTFNHRNDIHDTTYKHYETNNMVVNRDHVSQSLNNSFYENPEEVGTSQTNIQDYKVVEMNEEKKEVHEPLSNVCASSEDDGKWTVVTSKKQKRKSRKDSETAIYWDDKHDVTYEYATNKLVIGTTANGVQSVNNGTHESLQVKTSAQILIKDVKVDESNELHKTSSTSQNKGKWIKVEPKKGKRKGKKNITKNDIHHLRF